MDNIHDTIAKDASDRFKLMADEFRRDLADWTRHHMHQDSKKEGLKLLRFLDKTVDVLTLIYADEIDEETIQKIVVEQFSSTINVLISEVKTLNSSTI